LNPVEIIHNNYVVGRRAQILASHLSNLLPNNISVLDVGCGDGQIAATILKQRPDITIDGVDVLVRPASAISIKAFDGTNIPYNDNSIGLCYKKVGTWFVNQFNKGLQLYYQLY